jgi:hypothetical protein
MFCLFSLFLLGDVYKNKAACLKFDNNVLNIKQFIDSPHPYYLPNFMDVFQWSLPFVAEKVTDMLAHMLEWEGDGDDEEAEQKTVIQARGGLLKKKVTAVTKLLRMYKILRQENEAILQLKQLMPSNKIPLGLLSKGKDAIDHELKSFDSVKGADLANEKRPGQATAASHEKNVHFRHGSIIRVQTEPGASLLSSAGQPNSPPPPADHFPSISVIPDSRQPQSPLLGSKSPVTKSSSSAASSSPKVEIKRSSASSTSSTSSASKSAPAPVKK